MHYLLVNNLGQMLNAARKLQLYTETVMHEVASSIQAAYEAFIEARDAIKSGQTTSEKAASLLRGKVIAVVQVGN